MRKLFAASCTSPLRRSRPRSFASALHRAPTMSQQLLTPGYVRSDYPVPPPLSGSSNRDSLGSSFGGSVTFDHRISFSPQSREITRDGRSTPTIQLNYRVTLRWPVRAALFALAALVGGLLYWWVYGSTLGS